MKEFKNVKGSQPTVPSLEVNVDTVYVRTNIRRIETEHFTGWQYDEKQYTLREFHELIGNRTDTLEVENADLWFNNIMLELKANTIEKEVADLWFELIMGGR